MLRLVALITTVKIHTFLRFVSHNVNILSNVACMDA